MECSYCGADLKGKDVCSKCGRKVEKAPELEIEYKDFKVSEYLEIRRKEHRAAGGVETGAQEDKRPTIPSRVSRRMPRMEEKTPEDTRGGTTAKEDPTKETAATGTPGGKRASSLTVAIVLLCLAVLAGAIYLWRFLAR